MVESSHLVENRWPFRLHATYNETISRAFKVYEEINREIPFQGLHWFFDHCETITDENLDRIKALGGGIAIQNRMGFQGEYFVDRYGAKAAERTPPIRSMLERGIPVGAGTDATRVSSYNPYLSLHWLITGKTVGGLSLYPERNRFSREEALRLYTAGSAWFSTEENQKGAITAGRLADLAVLSASDNTAGKFLDGILLLGTKAHLESADAFEFILKALDQIFGWLMIAFGVAQSGALPVETLERWRMAYCMPPTASRRCDASFGTSFHFTGSVPPWPH